jgi:ribosomal protein S27E
MAKHKNIYSVDTYFLTFGWIIAIIAGLTILFSTWTIYQMTGDLIPGLPVPKFPLVRIIIACNGLLLIIAGIYFRRQEKKIIRIWDALDITGEARVNELAVSLGLSREFILKHLRTINMQPAAYYVWDEPTDKIIDGRLRSEFMVVQECPGCGHTINEKVSLSAASSPKCMYCGTAISTPESINKQRQEILMNRPVVHPQQKEINWVVFAILVFVFWPAALIYLVSRRKSIPINLNASIPKG